MIIDSNDVLNAGALQLIPQHTRRNVQIHFHGAWPKWRFIFEDWIVAMIDRLHTNDRLVLSGARGAARIIARPFTEGTFGARFF